MNQARMLLLIISGATACLAQDDVTTSTATSAYEGAYLTGPASNPLSFLNGRAYRTFGSGAPYLLPDFHPMSLLDEKLPNWISFGAEERLRFEGYHNGGFKQNNSDSYLLNRFRFQMNLRFTPWFTVVSQVQDARPFSQKPPIGPPNEVRWDLKLAYAQFGDPEKQWISVRVGRQLINYNNTLIANSEWRNQGRSYDAVVANFHFDRVRLGIFAASVVNPLIAGISHHAEGNNLYGMYGKVERVVPRAMLEPFVLWRIQQSVKQDEKAYGFRIKGILAGSLDYSYEGVVERGTDGPNPIRAWATTAGTAYRFNAVAWKPRLFAQYDYASGSKNPSGATHGTFDTMYPTAHDRFGISDQFGWQNIEAARGGFTIEPHARWTVTAQYLDFWLAQARDALYNTSGGAIVRDSSNRFGRHIGEEVDCYTWFELNRHVNIGAGVAHLMPGTYLANVTKGPVYTYPYFAINFKDDGKAQR